MNNKVIDASHFRSYLFEGRRAGRTVYPIR